MSAIRYRWLVVIALASGIAGWVANLWTTRNGYPAPVLSLIAMLTVLVIVAFTLLLGLRVRRWRNGNRDRELDPIAAARTLVLGQASAYAGAVLFGWHAGVFLDLFSLWSLRPSHAPTWASLAMTVGGVVMIATGLVVERFCRLPPDDREGSEDGSGPAGGGEYA